MIAIPDHNLVQIQQDLLDVDRAKKAKALIADVELSLIDTTAPENFQNACKMKLALMVVKAGEKQ